ncbi:hypothetical protein LCGC14_2872630, partial [marine sediment metagenome]
INYHELMQKCFDKWIDSCNKDYEYSQGFEYFKETSEANEWKYMENGKLFIG